MELEAAAAIGKFIGAGLAAIGSGAAAIGVGRSATRPQPPRRPRRCSSVWPSQKHWGSSRSSSRCC